MVAISPQRVGVRNIARKVTERNGVERERKREISGLIYCCFSLVVFAVALHCCAHPSSSLSSGTWPVYSWERRTSHISRLIVSICRGPGVRQFAIEQPGGLQARERGRSLVRWLPSLWLAKISDRWSRIERRFVRLQLHPVDFVHLLNCEFFKLVDMNLRVLRSWQF